jgi:hypothetical protein
MLVVSLSVRKGARRERWYPKISARRAGAMPAAAKEKAPSSRVNRLGRRDRASFFGTTVISVAYCRDAESDGRGHGSCGVEPCHDPGTYRWGLGVSSPGVVGESTKSGWLV